MRTMLVIPDGVGLRNFAHTEFLPRVTEKGPVSLLHVVPDGLVGRIMPTYQDRVEWHTLCNVRESPLEYALRYTLAYAHMMWGSTTAMRHNLSRPVRGSIKSKAVHSVARLISRAAAGPDGIRRLNSCLIALAQRSALVRHYTDLIARFSPDVLFCSNQKLPAVLPVVLAARGLGVPTATFVFSWDNMTSKGRIAAPFDHFFVWSSLMRSELLRFYPDVRPERVHVVGTPQFAPYFDPDRIVPRDVFIRALGGDPARPLVCYTGGDVSTVPEDHKFVEILVDAVRKGSVHGRPQVVLRPSPVDPGDRYEPVRRRHPDLLYSPPRWLHTQPGNTYKSIPMPEDVSLLANLVRHASVNVNVASTMTLDFAVNGKPVVNIAFDASNPPPFGRSLWDHYYQYEHYRPVVELGAAKIARNTDDLVEHLNAYLAEPELDRDARQALVDLEVGVPPAESCQRIVDTLVRIAN